MLFLLITAVSTEIAGGCKLAELVSYHVFGDIYGNKFITIVHCKVCPTNSGEIIEARLQVLMTDFLPLSSIAWTFFSSFTLIYGPFLMNDS